MCAYVRSAVKKLPLVCRAGCGVSSKGFISIFGAPIRTLVLQNITNGARY